MKKFRMLIVAMLAVIFMSILITGVVNAADCPVIITDITKEANVTTTSGHWIATENLNWLYDGNPATGMASDPSATSTTVVFTFQKDVTASSITFVVNSIGIASNSRNDGVKFDKLSNNNYNLKIVLTNKAGEEVYNNGNGMSTKDREDFSINPEKSFCTMTLTWNASYTTAHALWEVTVMGEDGTHPWELTETTTEPKCETSGIGIYTCSCGKEKVDDIEPTGHDLSYIWERDDAKGTHYRVCNNCNTRQSEEEHKYSYDCDESCNICAFVRDDVHHDYPEDCSTKCIYCNTSRETTTPHSLASGCDTICDVCSEKVTPTENHPWKNDCQAVCEKCQFERTVGDHKYSATCDEDCDICGAIRVTEHQWRAECDALCDKCGKTRNQSVEHVYSSDCDVDCNNCKTIREPLIPDHEYDNACDKTCNVKGCSFTRKVNPCYYDSDCDANCNYCNQSRTPQPHKYENEGAIFVSLPATTEAPGEMTKKCDACGKAVTEEIPMLEKESHVVQYILIGVAGVTVVSVAACGVYLVIAKKMAENKRLLAKLKAQQDAEEDDE